MLDEFNAAKPVEEVNVKEFDDLVSKLHAIRGEIDRVSDEKKKLAQSEEEIEGKILDLLRKTGKRNWEVPGIGLVYKINKYEVSFPKDTVGRMALEDYIKTKYGEEFRREIYSINYQSLNSFYKREAEKAKDIGLEINVPGLGMPVHREIIGFKQSKQEGK